MRCARSRDSFRVDVAFSDYHGALGAGMKALLLRRSGEDGAQAHIDEGEELKDVVVAEDLDTAMQWISSR